MRSRGKKKRRSSYYSGRKERDKKRNLRNLNNYKRRKERSYINK